MDPAFIAPTFGAFLRIALQDVRVRMLKAVHDGGYVDFQESHFAIFSYPLPHAIRPADLARQKRISRQALNYLLTQLEGLGYLERHCLEGANRRLIYLSPDGRKIAEIMFACLHEMEAEWSSRVGPERFRIFVDVLRAIGSDRRDA